MRSEVNHFYLHILLMHYLFHVEVGHSATHTHLLLNRVHQFHASFFTSHFVIYKLLNRRVTDPSGAHVSPCHVDTISVHKGSSLH